MESQTHFWRGLSWGPFSLCSYMSALSTPAPLWNGQIYDPLMVGLFSQSLTPWKHPIVYLSMKLDPAVARWPTCLRIIAAMAVLIKDEDKLTLGQDLTVTTPSCP